MCDDNMISYAGAAVALRRASADEAPVVLAVLDDAAAWLRRRGIAQWPERFRPAWVADGLSRGTTWLAELGGEPVATVTVDWADPLWPDDGAAGYVHRLAVRRGYPGLGAALLCWAAESVRDAGRRFVRLDCVAANPRLRAYYEAAGFVHCGDAAVGGAPGELLDRARPTGGHVTMVSRYERAIPPGCGCPPSRGDVPRDAGRTSP